MLLIRYSVFAVVGCFFQFHGVCRAQCEEGWETLSGSCFYIGTIEESSSLFTWYGARDWCLQHGADLATISDVGERNHIAELTSGEEMFKGGLWIGLNKLEDQRTFRWIDGDNSAYRDWSDGQPDYNNGLGMCAYQLTHPPGSCFTRLPPQMSTVKGLLNRPAEADGITTFNLFYSGKEDDEEGRTVCEGKCSEKPGCISYTYSAQRNPDMIWNGECVGTTDVQQIREPEQYAFAGVRRSCDDAGRWMTSNCAERQGFICQKRSSGPAPTPVPPTPPTTGYCPTGYFESSGNKCFKIVEQPEWDNGWFWPDALSLCRAGPGIAPDLASIHSAQENADIAGHLPEFSFGYWIGLNVFPQSSRWTWTDNIESEYVNWAQSPSLGNTCAYMQTEAAQYATWKSYTCSQKLGYICQTFKDGTALTAPTTVPHTCSKADYVNYGSICYKLVTSTATWNEANTACESDGAQLASIHGPHENAAIFLYTGAQAPLWIGYWKNAADEWAWTDNWPAVYTNFDLGEGPGTGGGCGLYKTITKWKDSDCTEHHAYLCKISTVGVLTTPAPVEGYCPDSWVEYTNMCYFFSTVQDGGSKIPQAANDDCAQRAKQFASEGSLTSIHHSAENEFIYQKLKSLGRTEAWIGLQKTTKDDPFTWIDGSIVQYYRWAPGEPNDKDGTQLCVEMYASSWPGLWNDHWCSGATTSLPYVCKAQKGIMPTPPYEPPGLVCPPGEQWKSRGRYCYYINLTARISFNDAQTECVKLGGRKARLAFIPDAETNLYLVELVKEMGGSYVRIWIGLVRKREDLPFRWLDGSNLTFTNWAPGEPNNMGDEHCGEFTGTGEWNDMNCITNPLAFICHINKEDVETGGPPPDDNPDDDNGGNDDKGWTAVYNLSHGEMAGVVIGTMICMLVLIGLIYLVFSLATGNRPTFLSSIQLGGIHLPKPRRKSDSCTRVETAMPRSDYINNGIN